MRASGVVTALTALLVGASPLPVRADVWVEQQGSRAAPRPAAELDGPAVLQGRDVALQVRMGCTDGLVEVGASVTQQTDDGRPVTGWAVSAPTACGAARVLVPAPTTAFVPGPAFVTLLVTHCRADRCEREQVISSMTVQPEGQEQVLLGDPTVQVRPVLVRVEGRARPVAHVGYRCSTADDVHSATAQLYARGPGGLALLSPDRPQLACDGRPREVTFRRPAALTGATVLVVREQRCRRSCDAGADGARSG